MFNKLMLKLFQSLGKTNLIDEFILIGKLNAKDFKAFFKWYLNREYNTSNKEAIFYYINIALYKNYFTPNEIEELTINSTCFETMPNDVVYYFLSSSMQRFNIKNLTLLITYLTTKITDIDTLINLIKIGLLDMDYALRKLTEVKDINKLITYSKNIPSYSTSEELFVKILNSGFYSLSDIKKYIFETDLAVSIVVRNLPAFYQNSSLAQQDLILDTLIEVASTPVKRTSTNMCVDLETNKIMSGCEFYASEISNSSLWPEEMKNKLAQKLLASKNYNFIYYWLSRDVNCSYNYEIIDNLLKEDISVIIRTLAFINDCYLEYAMMKIVKNKDLISKLLEIIYENQKLLFEISRIDNILSIVYHVHYNLKISKNNALSLILNGSVHTDRYMHEYEFNAEERDSILKRFMFKPAFMGIYGAFLYTGDKTKLLDNKIVQTKLAEIELARKKKK